MWLVASRHHTLGVATPQRHDNGEASCPPWLVFEPTFPAGLPTAADGSVRMPHTLPYVQVSPSDTSKASSTRPQPDRKRPSPAKMVGRKSGGRGDPLLACLNCRQKKVKVRDSFADRGCRVAYSGLQCQSGTHGCSRCLKLGLQCIEPDTDERKRYVELNG